MTHGQPMTLKTRIYSMVFFIWISGAIALAILLGYNNQKGFDPQQALSIAIMDLNFESNFSNAARLALKEGSKGYLMHIGTSNQCACEIIARNHQSSLDTFARQHKIAYHYIDIDGYPDLSRYVPSVPAVAFFDEQGRLKFFGPYSSGAGCFGSFGFIDSYLQSFIESKAPETATIVTDASGCYCENVQTTEIDQSR